MSDEVIIIGGGQACLATAYQLARRGIRFRILDAGPSVGHAWAGRWDSLKLFTPARYSGLPGMPFPGDPERYPGRDEVIAYLRAYADRFDLAVQPGEPVTRLWADPDGGYRVVTARAEYRASRVVVATGPFQRPAIPELASRLPAGVVQLHSSEYRNPDPLPAGEVLVVGGGNSGVQIAEEMAASRPTTLSVGEALPRLPQAMLGRSIFWWLERTGVLQVSGESWLGRRMRQRDTLIGSSPAMVARSRGVRLVDRIAAAAGGRLRTASGREIEPAAVVWATGYRPDYGWMDLPLPMRNGLPVHERGVTPLAGLYFIGLPWQHTRGSALIGFVGQDAAFLADRLAGRPARRASLQPV